MVNVPRVVGRTKLKELELRCAAGSSKTTVPVPSRVCVPEKFRKFPPLLVRLVDETWYGTGYCLPRKLPSKPEHIPVDVWCAPTLDPDANTVSGGGLKFVSVRFYEAKRRDGIKRSPCGSVSMGDLRTWMKKRVASLRQAGNRSSVRQDETAAREHFTGHSINRDWIVELRDEIGVPLNWSTRGRRKRPGIIKPAN